MCPQVWRGWLTGWGCRWSPTSVAGGFWIHMSLWRSSGTLLATSSHGKMYSFLLSNFFLSSSFYRLTQNHVPVIWTHVCVWWGLWGRVLVRTRRRPWCSTWGVLLGSIWRPGTSGSLGGASDSILMSTLLCHVFIKPIIVTSIRKR